jgi:hypothetical protein
MRTGKRASVFFVTSAPPSLGNVVFDNGQRDRHGHYTASVGTAPNMWHRVWPLIGVSVAVLTNAAWIIFVGYLVLKLFD